MKIENTMTKYFSALIGSLLMLSCSEDSATTEVQNNKRARENTMRTIDSAQIKRGRQIYLKNCTVCHGINGEGSPDWQKRLPDGTYPPPPLNGTGHAWHHPKKVLVDTIKHGTARLGGKMPAWKDKLSDQDINDIIAWFQSQWPDELYQAWQRMDRAKSNN